jgi:uncharacterized cupin superfamily protein
MAPNINRPEFDELRDHDGFRSRRARVGDQLGTERLGASLWEVPPGEAAYPYHQHFTDEELIVVLSGRPSLRTPNGWRELEEGDVVSFLPVASGAHQLANQTTETVRFLSVSTNGSPDIVLYPDSGKVGAFARGPGNTGYGNLFREADAVDYWDGEQPVPHK